MWNFCANSKLLLMQLKSAWRSYQESINRPCDSNYLFNMCGWMVGCFQTLTQSCSFFCAVRNSLPPITQGMSYLTDFNCSIACQEELVVHHTAVLNTPWWHFLAPLIQVQMSKSGRSRTQESWRREKQKWFGMCNSQDPYFIAMGQAAPDYFRGCKTPIKVIC